MKLQITQGMRQNLKMTPQLRQAIKLLHLSSGELEEEIENEIATNPVLERADYPKQTAEYSIDCFADSPATLRDYLYWQMHLTPFSETDQQIAINIIDAINDDGYLSTSLSSIVDSFTDISIEEATAVLHRIQQFDPIGVACRDLQECLALQNSDPLCAQIIENHMNLLANQQYRKIKQLLSLSDSQFSDVMHNILQLNPRPGAIFTTPVQKNEYIVPDVIVYKQNNVWRVRLNPDLNIGLRINKTYAVHLQSQYREAKWLLHSLETRNNTLLAVAKWIVKYQTSFFDNGADHMRPLRQRDIALDLDLNESTISRICSNKFLHSPRGNFGLKYFFANSVSRGCSSTAIKAIIKELVAAENKFKPLNDEQLRSTLADRGIKIARRTVAKYREAIAILPAHKRQQLA